MSGSGLLEGKVAVITGAASGQGRAAARLFADNGARILVADVDDAGADETVSMVAESGGEATSVHADVSIRADNEAMVAAAVDRWGRLDVLYNNAAVQMSGRLRGVHRGRVGPHGGHQPRRHLLGLPGRPPPPAGQRGRLDHQHRVGARAGRARRATAPTAPPRRAWWRSPASSRWSTARTVRANVIAPGSIDTPRFRKVAEDMGMERQAFLDMLHKNIPLHRLGHGRRRGRDRPVPRRPTCPRTPPVR